MKINLGTIELNDQWAKDHVMGAVIDEALSDRNKLVSLVGGIVQGAWRPNSNISKEDREIMMTALTELQKGSLNNG